jgi:hypothetical protein
MNSVQMPAKTKSGRSSFNVNQTTSFSHFSGFGLGVYCWPAEDEANDWGGSPSRVDVANCEGARRDRRLNMDI